MKWYKFPYRNPLGYRDCEIWLNDDNINPPWFSYKPPFTEFHIRSGSKTLLIAAGESWTYGEGLNGKISGAIKYDFFTQLTHCWAPVIGNMLGIDVLQYARAGCSNLYIFQELERLVKYAINLNMYDRILICCQMTDDSREFLCGSDIGNWKTHPLNSIIPLRTQKDFKDWLVDYDNLFFNILDSIVDYAKTKVSVDATLFRNLTKVSTNQIPKNFRIIPNTWIEYSSKLDDINLTSPYCWTLAKDNPNVKLSTDWATEQANLIKASMDYIIGVFKHTKLHVNHPTALGHKVWAEYLIQQSNWNA